MYRSTAAFPITPVPHHIPLTHQLVLPSFVVTCACTHQCGLVQNSVRGEVQV